MSRHRTLQNDEATNVTTETSEDDSPVLLNTLPLHQEWIDFHGTVDFSAHGPSDNKLESHLDEATGEEVYFCHLVSLNPFTRNNGTVLHGPAYESALAVMLAVQQLNTGDPSIIPELAELQERCPIQFSVEFVDTEFDVGLALNRAIAITHPHTTNETEAEMYSRPQPCAFLGASRSAVSGPTSIITSLEDYVQVSGESTSVDLDDRTQYPRFARTIPSDAGTAEALVLFLTKELGLTHLAVLNINDSFGNAYATMIRDAARQYAPTLEIVQIPMDHRGGDFSIVQDDIVRGVTALRQSQLLYSLVVLLDTATHDAFMLEAHKQGLAGSSQHNFMFTDGFDYTNALLNRSFHPDDPLFQAYSGTGVIRASGGISGEEKRDTLAQRLQEIKQSAPDMQYVSSQLAGNMQPDDDALSNLSYQHSPPFNYDSTVLLGLSVCAAATNNDLFLSGTVLYEQLSQSVFEGVTGTVVLESETKTRVANSSYFSIRNLVGSELAGVDGENKTVVFQAPLALHFSKGKWNESQPFVFSDGTTMNPQSLRAVTVETNYVHPVTRAVILTFSAVAIIAAVVCAAWTWHNREKRIVRASQPFFLILVCFGTLLFAATIIPMSFDGGNLSAPGLNRACTSIVWLLSLGVAIVFSALFSKTHRVRKIMKSAHKCRRIKVTIRETATPIVILLSINVAILTAMAVLDPVEHSIIVLNRDRFDRVIESYGMCAFGDSKAFIIPLFIMNITVILATLIEAWLARNLSTEFQESECIFRLAASIAALVAIGVPVVVLARATPDASVFIASGVTFLICTDILWMLFLPKMRYKEKVIKPTISGLNLSSATLAAMQPSVSKYPTTASTDNGDVSDDDTASLDGERILAVKNRHDLAEEVVLLKRMLRAKDRREQMLRSNGTHVDRVEDAEDIEKLLEDGPNKLLAMDDELDITDATRAMNNLSTANGGKKDDGDVNHDN